MKVVSHDRVDRRANTFGPASGVLCVAAAVVLGIATPIDRLEAQDKGLVPDRLWAAQISPSSIVLTWLTNPKARQYKLFACSVSDCTVARLLGTVGAATTRFVVALGSMRGAQRFAIEAVDEKGLTSGKMPFNTITLVDKNAVATTPPAPASVTAAESGNRITVTWDAVPGATGYFIGRSIAPGGFQTICRLCPTETSFVDSTIKSGSKHIYTVAAYTPAGMSRRRSSNAVTPGGTSAVVVAGPIEPPSGGKAVATSPTAVTITWDKSASAIGYRVYRSIGGQAFQLLVTVGGGVASFVDYVSPTWAGVIQYGLVLLTGKGPSAMEYIPFDKAAVGTSAPSPPPVTNAAGTYTATGMITLTWTHAPTATGYRIERSLSGGAWQTVSRLPMNSSSYVDETPGVLKQNPKYQIFTLVGTTASRPVVFVLVPAPKG